MNIGDRVVVKGVIKEVIPLQNGFYIRVKPDIGNEVFLISDCSLKYETDFIDNILSESKVYHD